MRSANLMRGRAFSLTLAATLAAGALVAVAGPSQAATAKMTAAPATGKGAAAAAVTATNVITVTGSGFTDAAGASLLGTSKTVSAALAWNGGSTAVQLNTATTCPAQAVTADAVTAYNVLAPGDTPTVAGSPTFTVVSATKLIVTLPTLALGASSAAKAYSLCVYDNSAADVATAGTVLLGQATYTVYPQPTVSSVTPSQGSIVGGNTVTVVGVNFTSKATASLNGVKLANVKVAKDNKSLTATIPATSTIPKITSKTNLGGTKYDLSVTTEGGDSTYTTAAGNDDYTYVNAVTVSPKLAATAGGTTLTVTGKGFLTILNPTVGTPTTNARVMLIPGKQFDSTATVATYYDWPWKSGSATGYTGTAGGTLDTTFVCTNVKVVSDTELTCKSPALPTGTYTVTLVDNFLLASVAGTDFFYQTVPSSSATITVGAF